MRRLSSLEWSRSYDDQITPLQSLRDAIKVRETKLQAVDDPIFDVVGFVFKVFDKSHLHVFDWLKILLRSCPIRMLD